MKLLSCRPFVAMLCCCLSFATLIQSETAQAATVNAQGGNAADCAESATGAAADQARDELLACKEQNQGKIVSFQCTSSPVIQDGTTTTTGCPLRKLISWSGVCSATVTKYNCHINQTCTCVVKGDQAVGMGTDPSTADVSFLGNARDGSDDTHLYGSLEEVDTALLELMISLGYFSSDSADPEPKDGKQF